MHSDDFNRRMWAEACGLIERAEQLHRQFFRPGRSMEPMASWEPPVDIYETDEMFLVLTALPGVQVPNLEVTVEGNEIRVAGVRRLPAIAREASIHRLEIPHGRFERRIRMPASPLVLDRSELVDGCLFLQLTKQR